MPDTATMEPTTQVLNQEMRPTRTFTGEISHEQIQLVTFRLGSEEYGVDIMKVQEIIKMQKITQVPNAPDFMKGLLNLRGKVIPVIDIRRRFQLESGLDVEQTRIIVMDIGGQIVGITVDSVSEVLRLPQDKIEPVPATLTNIDTDYLKGVGRLEGRLLILLDLDRFLSSQTLSHLTHLRQD